MVRGNALWLALAVLYGVLLAQSWRADTLALMFPPAWPPLPRLSAIAAMFERPAAAAAFWVHLLTLDLLVARFVLQDGVRRRRADTLALMFPPAWPPLPRLSAIAAMFERPAAAAAFWVHLLTLDLLVARFVLQDGERRRRADRSPVAPALLACMMFGPTGLMLHAATRRLLGLRRGGATQPQDTDAAASRDV